MSQEDKLVRIRQKTDTAEGWLASNPILLYGELGIEIDTQLIKIGDGVTPWAGLPYVLKDQIINLTEQVDNKANKDFSNVSSLTSTVKDTLGIATRKHDTTNTSYGPASTNNYGHVRTSGITGSGHYVQSQRAYGATNNLNSSSYLYAGNHLINFTINNTSGLPTTISADTGITSDSSTIYGIIKTDNCYRNGTSHSNAYGIKQTLVIPRYGLTYERYGYQGSNNFGDWDKLVNFKMPEDITCNTLSANTISAGSMIGVTISSDTDIIATDNLKGKSNFELRGENTSGESVVYKSGPLIAPLYVGTIHADWNYSDWTSEVYPPHIDLQNSDGSVTFSGYLTEKFSPNDYDIIISFDDTTMNNYYSEIAECGLYVKSDGAMGIGNHDALQNSSLNGVTLGVNISIYYTGGGIL